MANNNQTQRQNLSDLLNNGLYIEQATNGKYKSMAFFSLVNALKTYFKTAYDLTDIIKKEGSSTQDQLDKETIYSGYATDVCDTILHLQHFIELYLKEVLLSVSPLLVYDIKKEYEIQLKLIQNQTIQNRDLEKIYYIECGEAIDKLKKIINEPAFVHYKFLGNHFDFFTQINKLRNRIAHRGVFVLKYEYLDVLFGKYVFPFISDLKQSDPDYTYILKKDFELKLNVNPFDELIQEYKKINPNKYKVYVLKMIAHAAYNNKIPSDESTQYGKIMSSFYKEKRKNEEYKANAIYNSNDLNHQIHKLVNCPVCGCKTLFVYYDYCDEEDNNGQTTKYYNWINAILCHQCGFQLQERPFLESSSNEINEINYYEEW